MNLLRAATLAVTDPDATAARYVRWFDYRLVDSGTIPEDLAASWGAPASAGRRFTVCAPRSGAGVFVRFVAAPALTPFRPLRTFGWAALELCVQDVLATDLRMRMSPFRIIGPPRLLDTMPEIHPMQVEGPDGEIVYLTEIKADPPGTRLPRAACAVDRLFILVLAAEYAEETAHWLAKAFGLRIGIDAPITYSMLAQAFDLPIERKHRIITLMHDTDTFLEIDQYPEAAAARPCEPGGLPGGIALATLCVADLDSLDGEPIAPAVSRQGAIYAGARACVLRGPGGLLIEAVEHRPPSQA